MIEPMVGALGPLQQTLLAALRRHGRAPTRSQYVSAARAVATLRRRGLIHTRVAGVARGRLEWPRNGSGVARPTWRFKHPGKRLIVRLTVDSFAAKL
jgi:hypothetical protein